MPIDPLEDFEPVAMIATVPRLVLVHPSLEVKNLDQLIRLARDQPGKLACGTADQFSQHSVRLFERQAGVKLDCAHFDGAVPLRAELVSGRRKIAFESTFLPEVQAGQLLALAVAGASRVKSLPDVPTTSEAGLPGFEAVVWHVLVAPKGTDRGRVETLANAIDAAIKHPAFLQSLEARGFIVRPMSGAQMRTFLQRDMQLWRRTS
jgi:tripartite-type tricarboxylate transporter receptor subunit TctC